MHSYHLPHRDTSQEAKKKMAALASIELPVKMSLHSVIPKENIGRCKELSTIIIMQSNLFLKPAPLEIPLLLKYNGYSWLVILLKLETTQLLQEVHLHCKQVSIQAKDAQGKEFKFTHDIDNTRVLVLKQSQNSELVHNMSELERASSDIDVEVKMILLEAKFRVISEVALPPCSCDLLTTQALTTQERYTDVKITITTEQEATPPVHFFAHKDVLVARSPVLAKMFEHNLQESTTSSITVSDIEPEVLKEVLAYIYTNQVPRVSTMASSLLYAAEKYELDGLKVRCEQFLSYNLQVSNAVQTLQLAQTYNASQLKENALRFIVEYIDEVRESEDWEIVKSNCDIMVALLGSVEPAAKRPKNN